LSSSILPIYFYDLFRINFKVEFSMDLFYLFKDDNCEFCYLIMRGKEKGSHLHLSKDSWQKVKFI